MAVFSTAWYKEFYCIIVLNSGWGKNLTQRGVTWTCSRRIGIVQECKLVSLLLIASYASDLKGICEHAIRENVSTWVNSFAVIDPNGTQICNGDNTQTGIHST